jgi:hypothetical protein
VLESSEVEMLVPAQEEENFRRSSESSKKRCEGKRRIVEKVVQTS